MSILKESPPIFYSFRRCPYAMRARLSLVISKTRVELREVYLKEKPKEFLDSSVSATVPCMVTQEKIIDESLDIMLWVLKKNDPQNWLKMPKIGFDLIKENDGPFKHNLDKTKYHSRYPEINPEESRKKASIFLIKLENMMYNNYLFGNHPSLADMAILPFVRQFANTDFEWFEKQNWPNVKKWLNTFISSEIFNRIQIKYDKWSNLSKPQFFPN
jgi:glutathione S-transferase